MRMNRGRGVVLAVGLAISTFSAAPALANLHLWQIQEVYSSADGTVQFIELFTCCNTQQFLANASITVSDGMMVIDTFPFLMNSPSPTGLSIWKMKG